MSNRNGESEKGFMIVMIIGGLAGMILFISMGGYLLAAFMFFVTLMVGERLYLEDSKEDTIVLFGSVTLTQIILVSVVLVFILMAIQTYEIKMQ